MPEQTVTQELTMVEIIRRRYAQAHQALLKLTDGLPEGVVRWRPEHGPQCIAWQVWHVARWDDYMVEVLIKRNPDVAGARSATQTWADEGLAGQWGFDAAKLGQAEAGTETDEEDSAALPWPPFSDVLAYATTVFARVEDAIGMLDDGRLTLPVRKGQAESGTYGENILGWLEHVREHIGTIQALRGLSGLSGIDL